jgi:hypothetical protein
MTSKSREKSMLGSKTSGISKLSKISKVSKQSSFK